MSRDMRFNTFETFAFFIKRPVVRIYMYLKEGHLCECEYLKTNLFLGIN